MSKKLVHFCVKNYSFIECFNFFSTYLKISLKYVLKIQQIKKIKIFDFIFPLSNLECLLTKILHPKLGSMLTCTKTIPHNKETMPLPINVLYKWVELWIFIHKFEKAINSSKNLVLISFDLKTKIYDLNLESFYIKKKLVLNPPLYISRFRNNFKL